MIYCFESRLYPLTFFIGIGRAEERAEESEVDEEYQGDGENSESTMEQLSSDTCGLYSDFQSEESDLDLDLSN